MSRRWRNFFFIFFGLLAIPTSFLGIGQLYNWFWPNAAKLRVLVKQDEVQIPSAYHEFLRALDSNIPGRQTLVEIHDAAAAALKNSRSSTYPENDLKALRAFAESSPVFRFSDPHVITVKIVNVGGKVANNVKVFFPNEGFVEITKDDAVVIAEQTKGWIDLLTLEPSSQFIATMWTTGPREGVRVLSDGGAANVRQWYVSREENRWVIGFGPAEIGLLLILALAVFSLILPIVLAVMERRLQRAIEAHEENGAPPG